MREADYGISATAIERTDKSQPKYIRITDFSDNGIEEKHTFTTVADYLPKHVLNDNDILFARSGATVGKTYQHKKTLGLAVFAGYCIRFVIDPTKAIPEYVYWYTKTQKYAEWVRKSQRPSGQPNINKEEYKSLEVVLPSRETQTRLATEMSIALKKYNEKLCKADELLEGIDGFVSELIGLPSKNKVNKICFAIKYKNLDGVISAKRYQSVSINENMAKIISYCNIIENKVNVKNLNEEIVDWIRIDDLSNKPWEIGEVRTLFASEMEGSFFVVETGDVLVARLGPTILNQKVVVVNETYRRTLASAEFLVLRCKENCSPTALMWVIRTTYFKELMYSKTRGSTPSRYRLNREDMLNLKLPFLSTETQNFIVCEVKKRREKALTLKHEAETEWANAKERFEKELLGG
ncbi:MAG: restriction endonuclease subunit S [Oscillospiraceae bacterium]|nr:restriction endonuclease subunit S [Oscillospiraceae bacterium]